MNVFNVVGAVLGAVVTVIVIDVAGSLIFGLATPTGSAVMPIKTSYAAGMAAYGAAAGAAAAPDGAQVTQVCKTCHSLDKGGPNKVGPALWGVVGRPVASMANFNYSDAVKKLGGDWTEDRLDKWLSGPAAYAPGTKMTFKGFPDAASRKAAIDFLKTLK